MKDHIDVGLKYDQRSTISQFEGETREQLARAGAQVFDVAALTECFKANPYLFILAEPSADSYKRAARAQCFWRFWCPNCQQVLQFETEGTLSTATTATCHSSYVRRNILLIYQDANERSIDAGFVACLPIPCLSKRNERVSEMSTWEQRARACVSVLTSPT